MALQEHTIRYKTYVKTALVEGLRGVFKNHKDSLLAETNVTLEYPRKLAEFPAVIVRFLERDISNMGVGHEEHIAVDGPDGQPKNESIYRFRHYLYHADVELAVQALTSKDRDLVADTLVQTLAMSQLEAYTNRFFERIWPDEREGKYPDSIWHFININTDKISGGGEYTEATPWQSEDDLVYKTSYRSSCMGEFYSVPPDLPKEYISKVVLLPYIGGVEPVPEGETPGTWEPFFGEEFDQ